MTRAIRFLIHNWPLKVGAVVMAVLLYVGLVLSENDRTFEGRIPIEGINQPTSIVVLSELGDVRMIRYFAPDNAGIRVDSNSFRATVDFSAADSRSGLVELPVRVVPTDPRIQVREFEPSRINVEIDEVVTREVPVTVDTGTPPDGLDVRTPELSTQTVSVAGPASVVKRVASAIARVRIDPSGLDIDRDVELIPVDDLGEELRPVDVTPANVHVQVAVFTNRETKSIPVAPVIDGQPPAGLEITSVTVDPPVVSVEGDADQLVGLDRLETAPVSLAGASDLTMSVVTDLALPAGVLPLGDSSVTVRVTFRLVSSTRTLSAGVVLLGARLGYTYRLDVEQVLVTVGGSSADLGLIDAASFTVRLDVTTLEPGTHEVAVTADLPSGISLITASPAAVSVTVTGPASSATASASPTAGP